MEVDGILVVAKPRGLTSHDVVSRIRRVLGMKRAGHAGTLDPDATGVLLVLLGRATGAMQFMVGLPKAYTAEMVLGVTTDTQDASGKVLCVAPGMAVSRDSFLEALAGFRGEVWQVPPMVSAVHHDGRRLYELARSGVEVERKPRRVRIYDLSVESWPEEPLAVGSRVVLSIVCSSGTYVRQLVSDIGDALGCGAHVGALVRTRVGKFDLASSHTMEEIEALVDRGAVDAIVAPIAEGLSHLPGVTVGVEDASRVSHGQAVTGYAADFDDRTPHPAAGDLVRVHGPSGQLLCVACAEEGERCIQLRPVRVFAC